MRLWGLRRWSWQKAEHFPCSAVTAAPSAVPPLSAFKLQISSFTPTEKHNAWRKGHSGVWLDTEKLEITSVTILRVVQKVHYSLKLYFLRHQPELLDWGDTDPLTASDSERSGEDKGGYHLTRMWFKKKKKCKSKNMITPKKHTEFHLYWSFKLDLWSACGGNFHSHC